jgi:hypothetical protein
MAFYFIYTKRPEPLAKNTDDLSRQKFLQGLPNGALIVNNDRITFANQAASLLIPIATQFDIKSTRIFR